jgi:Arc/MetJ-type ribon-helix-helix transcriptional regulator
MAVEIAVPVDEKVSRYVHALVGEGRKNYSDVVRALLEEGYKREIEKLHASYSRGEITLRGMARRLGLNYRELYQLLADKGLPL